MHLPLCRVSRRFVERTDEPEFEPQHPEPAKNFETRRQSTPTSTKTTFLCHVKQQLKFSAFKRNKKRCSTTEILPKKLMHASSSSAIFQHTWFVTCPTGLLRHHAHSHSHLQQGGMQESGYRVNLKRIPSSTSLTVYHLKDNRLTE